MSYYFYQAADGSYCNLARASRIYLKTEEEVDDPAHLGTYTLTTTEDAGIGVYALIDGVEYLLTGSRDQDREAVKSQLRSIMNDLVRAHGR